MRYYRKSHLHYCEPETLLRGARLIADAVSAKVAACGGPTNAPPALLDRLRRATEHLARLETTYPAKEDTHV